MSHQEITNREIEKLKDLIGKEIYTGGTCISQDENGVAHHCEMAHYTGILRKINYDEKISRLHSIVVECESGIKGINEVTFPTEDDKWTWDMCRGIYHMGQQILEVKSKSVTYDNKKYVIKGDEEVYDAFDEFEHSNPLEIIEVDASSVADAVKKGKDILQSRVTEERRKGGYLFHGSFVAHVEEVSDLDGNVLYKDQKRIE